MAKLKLKISTSAWEKLEPAVQEMYVDNGEGYALDVELEDTAALRRAYDRTKEELKDARKAKFDAETELEELDTNDARKRGDIEKLTKQWEDKETAKAAEHATAIATLHEHISSTSVDAIVSGVAGRNTGTKENAALLDPHIRQSLSVEFTDDGPQVMMAAAGGAIPLDLEKFEKTIVDNPSFAAIIVSNKASGGGASDKNKQGQEGGAFRTDTNGQSKEPVDLATASPADLAKMLPIK